MDFRKLFSPQWFSLLTLKTQQGKTDSQEAISDPNSDLSSSSAQVCPCCVVYTAKTSSCFSVASFIFICLPSRVFSCLPNRTLLSYQHCLQDLLYCSITFISTHLFSLQTRVTIFEINFSTLVLFQGSPPEHFNSYFFLQLS